jgi:hypothetical protein
MAYIVALFRFCVGCVIGILLMPQFGEPLELARLNRRKRYLRMTGEPVSDGSDHLYFVREQNGSDRVVAIRVPSGMNVPLLFRVADKEGGGVELIPIPLKA